MKNKLKHILSAAVFISMITLTAEAQQLNNVDGRLEYNPYLANPAMAGWKNQKGLVTNLHYRRIGSAVDGSPLTKVLSLDGRMGEGYGAGLQVFNTTAGLLSQTNLMGSFAYHAKLKEDEYLHLGFSMGVNIGRIDMSKVVGQANDPALLGYNAKSTFNSDFGLTYEKKSFLLQGALYNLSDIFKAGNQNQVGHDQAFVSLSNKFKLLNGAELTPRVLYISRTFAKELGGAGLSYGFSSMPLTIHAYGYTNQSYSAGVGFRLSESFLLNCFYVKPGIEIRNSINEQFELGMKWVIK